MAVCCKRLAPRHVVLSVDPLRAPYGLEKAVTTG